MLRCDAEQGTRQRRRVLPLIAVGLLLLASCNRQPEPLRVGMIASLSGRAADVGVAARDGAILAVEQLNRAGGIDGRPVELQILDLANDPQQAVAAITTLADAGVTVAVGPALSSMAVTVAPVAEKAGILLVAPTVSTNYLSDKDDLFLRVYPQCRDTAHHLAEYVYNHQHRNVAIILELSNRAFTESWRDCFREHFEQLGGEVSETGFTSGPDQSFHDLVDRALRSQPDGLLILSNAIDAAMIVQQVKKQLPALPVFLSEWSFTRELLLHGGRAVEGALLFHTFNEQSQAPRYLAFVDAFRDRFGRTPSFPAVHAYDAMSLALSGLQAGGRSAAEIKQILLARDHFDALQSSFRLNRYGDVERDLYLTTVRDGTFVVLEGGER